MTENPIAKNETITPIGIAGLGPVVPIKEATRLLGVSRTFLWQAVKAGQIGHYRLGRRVFFGPAHLKEFLSARETCATRAA